jgi:hypothetical protein
MEKSMISAGLATKQKHERSGLNGRHPANGTAQTNQYIKRIAAPFLTPDTKPSKLGEHSSLTWLPKILLFVDARYQRQATGRNSLRMIRRMIEEFAWSKFQPITVAEIREGSHSGHYAVIDGQHRAIAAIALPSVTEVPCWIVNAAGGAINHLPPRQTQAVSTIRRLLATHGDGPVTAALKALATAFPETPWQLRGQIIEAVSTIFAKLGAQIDAAHFVAILAERDCEEFIEDARKYRKMMRGSTKGAMIAALIKAYDKGRSPGRHLVPAKSKPN